MKKAVLLLLAVVLLIALVGIVGNAVAKPKPEKVAICHYPGPSVDGKTLYVPLPALYSHLAHGDTFGECGLNPYP